MWNLFKEPPLRAKLTRLLAEAREARINATAMVAKWRHEDIFQRAEIDRLTAEIARLDAEASAGAAPALQLPVLDQAVGQPGHTQSPLETSQAFESAWRQIAERERHHSPAQ